GGGEVRKTRLTGFLKEVVVTCDVVRVGRGFVKLMDASAKPCEELLALTRISERTVAGIKNE
ncbi:hypothetical protein HY991_03635, partial [Candidatus Micrarchaeota archaeon]|nr:hypothetical protein [Candidatus Micrarchaeota archaeon]